MKRAQPKQKELNDLEFVVEELANRHGKWPVISAESGVPYFTLAKIAAGTIANPGYSTVMKLANYLRSNKRD